MNLRPVFSVCALMLGNAASADTQRFNAAYESYREAVAAGRYAVALGHAAEARRLGESLYPDDLRRTATLMFNHGAMLGKLNRHDEAYPILKRARKLMREAFGEDTREMLNVELSLLDSAPPNGVRHHMEEGLELARTHHAGDSEFIAGIKLKGALRLWGKDATSLLREAAEAYQAAGNTQGYALVHFWMGKKHLSGREYRSVPKPMEVAIEALPEGHHLALMAHAHLVEAYEHLGQSEMATAHCLAIGRTKPWTGNDDYQPLFKRAPSYPLNALRRDKEGFVVLEFTVNEMGFVRNPEIVESKGGKVFHEPAIEAAKGFRYALRFVDGKAVAVPEVRNRIVFEMRR